MKAICISEFYQGGSLIKKGQAIEMSEEGYRKAVDAGVVAITMKTGPEKTVKEKEIRSPKNRQMTSKKVK